MPAGGRRRRGPSRRSTLNNASDEDVSGEGSADEFSALDMPILSKNEDEDDDKDVFFHDENHYDEVSFMGFTCCFIKERCFIPWFCGRGDGRS